jgi:hypothetical protein
MPVSALPASKKATAAKRITEIRVRPDRTSASKQKNDSSTELQPRGYLRRNKGLFSKLVQICPSFPDQT